MTMTTSSEQMLKAPSRVIAQRPSLTKIVSTLGPASSELQTIVRLADAGVGVFRLNFSHGDFATHERSVELIREAAQICGRPLAILGDLQGPKIRVGPVGGDGLDVPTGAIVVFQRDPVIGHMETPSNVYRFSSTYENLVTDVMPGQRLLIDDGQVRMLVVDRSDNECRCTVTEGGRISSGKGINLPESELSVDAITDRDWEFVDWAVEHDIDFLALSFVRHADDVRRLAAGVEERRAAGGRSFVRLPIVAKIERPEALESIEAIAEAADVIMVARGDLGVEMDLARVPVLQKRLIEVAQQHGKPCIVATQMLQSMIESSSPTRAEVSDVAGAIFDRADAVMLSGETAVGKHPVLAVDMMRRVALETEASVADAVAMPSPPSKPLAARHRTAALAHGAWTIAQDLDACLVAVWSQQGGGARLLSQNNFTIPIVAFSSDIKAARQMQMLLGVIPLVAEPPENLAEFSRLVDHVVQRAGLARPGDVCLLMAGGPIGQQGVTNSIAVHAVGDPNTGYIPHHAFE